MRSAFYIRIISFSGHIKIKILPPIPTKGKSVDDLEKIVDQAYTVLSENVDLLSSADEEKNANYKLKANWSLADFVFVFQFLWLISLNYLIDIS